MEQWFYGLKVLTRLATGPNCQATGFISVYDPCSFWIGMENMDTRLCRLHPHPHRKQQWHTTSANAQPSGTIFGDFWEIPRSVSNQATRWPKRGSCGGPRMSTGLTERVNSNVYAKVNVKTLLLIPTSSRPEKTGVSLRESPDTPGMKGHRGILIHFPF